MQEEASDVHVQQHHFEHNTKTPDHESKCVLQGETSEKATFAQTNILLQNKNEKTLIALNLRVSLYSTIEINVSSPIDL